MLGNKLATNYYWYNDEYMYFSFNGHHSSKYHLFIQNTKDLTIENTVGAASEYSNAMMQEGTYYLGTSRKQKTFKRKCAAEIEDMRDYKRMMKWLTVGTTGELVFDSDRYWGWTVVLDTVGDATFVKRGGHIVVEFEVAFKTIGTYLAHSVYPATWTIDFDPSIETYDTTLSYTDIIGTNEYGIPSIITLWIHGDILTEQYAKHGMGCYIYMFLQDIGNSKKDIQLSVLTQKSLDLIVEHNDKIYSSIDCQYDDTDTIHLIEYDSCTSFASIDGQPAEENNLCKSTYQPNGILSIQSQEPVELYTTNITVTNNRIKIYLDDESWNEFKSGNYNYICISKANNNNTAYSTSEYIITSGQDYIADTWSYCGLTDVDDNFGLLLTNAISENFGTINTKDSEKSVIIDVTVNDPNKIINNQFKVYCGYSQVVKAFVPRDPIQLRSKVISYNNL